MPSKTILIAGKIQLANPFIHLPTRLLGIDHGYNVASKLQIIETNCICNSGRHYCSLAAEFDSVVIIFEETIINCEFFNPITGL